MIIRIDDLEDVLLILANFAHMWIATMGTINASLINKPGLNSSSARMLNFAVG